MAGGACHDAVCRFFDGGVDAANCLAGIEVGLPGGGGEGGELGADVASLLHLLYCSCGKKFLISVGQGSHGTS